MLNGDYEPSRWDTQKVGCLFPRFFESKWPTLLTRVPFLLLSNQKSLVRSACDSIFAGFGDAQSAQAFFGLISTNGRNTGLVIPPCKGTYPQLMEALQGLSFDGIDGTVDLDRALKLHKVSPPVAYSDASVTLQTDFLRVILSKALAREGSFRWFCAQGGHSHIQPPHEGLRRALQGHGGGVQG